MGLHEKRIELLRPDGRVELLASGAAITVDASDGAGAARRASYQQQQAAFARPQPRDRRRRQRRRDGAERGWLLNLHV
jgi:hypothetical protein